MGEAKRKREKLAADLLVELDRWSQPPSDSEQRIVDALQTLPVLTLERQPKDVLDYMRMKPRQCHLNCDEYQRLDPEKKSRAILGWRPINAVYVLHSVVERDGVMSCITPAPFESNNTIEFIVDDQLTKTRGSDEKYVFARDGAIIEFGVREDPTKVTNVCTIMRTRLAAGISPHTVMEEAFDLLGF